MKIDKRFILPSALLLLNLVVAGYLFSSPGTTTTNCMSTFTRNSYQDYGFFFKGSFIVNLQKNGAGELTIRAYTDKEPADQVMRTYKFTYSINSLGQIYTRDVHESKGALDNVDDKLYRKYFFDLAFDSRGQIRLSHYKNTNFFMSPELIISACSPLN